MFRFCTTRILRSRCVSVGGAIGIGILTILSIPKERTEPPLSNHGVRNRSVGATLTSKVADRILSEQGYDRVAMLVPYVKECSKTFNIPSNVLLAILYEEAIHRKPLDVRTFGVAQLGVGELQIQGLPPDANLYNNDRFSVWMLSRKLKRLQLQTGSLQAAITLHNGYSDYLPAIQRRSRDPRIKQLLESRRMPKIFTV